jgi:hypothetical protein
MQFSALDSPSDNALKDQLNQYDNLNTDFDNFNDLKINNNNNTPNNMHYPSFFNAQGDYESNAGTTINQLKNNISIAEDTFSLDSTITAPSIPKPKPQKNVYDHDYYASKFARDMMTTDLESLMSNNDKVYKHVKSCKICKQKVKGLMKDQYCPDILPQVNVEHFDGNIIGYDIKELILIILGGIILIFVFDLLVRVGRICK